MASGYFKRVHQETPTRFWINNPTLQEVAWALEADARNLTTNPTYCSRIIELEPDYMRPLIDEVVREVEDDREAAEVVYRRAGQRLAEQFLPPYERSGGKEGFVTMQGDPDRDDDADFIFAEALRHRKAGPNIMAKIPAIPSGIAAIERLVEQDVPICATEIFAVDQAIDVWEAYLRASKRSGKSPALFVTHITGIFDKYLSQYVEQNNIEIDPAVLAQAGWAVAHEQHRIFQERGYPGKMLGGGAQLPRHFSDMVGGQMDVTINWSTAKELLDADGPVEARLLQEPSKKVIDELSEKLPAFRQAYYVGGLKPEEYKPFGPLVLFRDWFVDGYNKLVAEVKARRALA